MLPHVVTLLRLVRFGLKEVTVCSLCLCAELVPNFRDEFDALAGGDALFREARARAKILPPPTRAALFVWFLAHALTL